MIAAQKTAHPERTNLVRKAQTRQTIRMLIARESRPWLGHVREEPGELRLLVAKPHLGAAQVDGVATARRLVAAHHVQQDARVLCADRQRARRQGLAPKRLTVRCASPCVM